MAETTSRNQPKVEQQPKPEPEAAPARLLPASESSDPAVHQLLGNLQTARMNRAQLDPSKDEVAAADAALAAAEKALADAGYC